MWMGPIIRIEWTFDQVSEDNNAAVACDEGSIDNNMSLGCSPLFTPIIQDDDNDVM